MAKAAVDLVSLGQQDRHIAQNKVCFGSMHLDDQHIELLDVVNKTGNLFVVDVISRKVSATEFQDLLDAEILACNHFF